MAEQNLFCLCGRCSRKLRSAAARRVGMGSTCCRKETGKTITQLLKELDEQEAARLRQRVLGRVLEDFYAGIVEDENARLLAETLGAGRDDRALEALVLDLHQKTQSHPHPLRWLEELKRDWARTPGHLPDTGCGRYLMEDALRKADFWSRRLTQAVEDMADYPAVYKAYGDRFLEAAQALEHLRDKAEQGWDSLGQAVPVFRRMGAVRGDENAACRDRSKAVLEQCKKALKDIQATFSVPEEELLEDLRQMAPAMLALLDLTAEFGEAYRVEKLRLGVEPVIELLRAHGKVPRGKAGVELLVRVRQLARLVKLKEGVGNGAGVAAEVALIGLREHLGNRIGYAAHAERQHRAVRNLLDHQLGDGDVRFARLAVGAKRQRLMLALDNIVRLGEVDADRVFKAVQPRIVLVDFKNDRPRALEDRAPRIRRDAEAAIALRVRLGDRHERHVAADVLVAVEIRQRAQHDRHEFHEPARLELPLIVADVPAIVGEALLLGI